MIAILVAYKEVFMAAVNFEASSSLLQRDRVLSERTSDVVLGVADKIDRSVGKFVGATQTRCEVVKKTGYVLACAATGASIGAGAGFLAGTAVPGLGNGVGATLGAVGGGLAGGVAGFLKISLILDGEFNAWLGKQSETEREELLKALGATNRFDYAECFISKDMCRIPMRFVKGPDIVCDLAQLNAYFSKNGMYHPALSSNVPENAVTEAHYEVDYAMLGRMNRDLADILTNVAHQAALTAKQREGLHILLKDQNRFIAHCFELHKKDLDKEYARRMQNPYNTLATIRWYGARMQELVKELAPQQ